MNDASEKTIPFAAAGDEMPDSFRLTRTVRYPIFEATRILGAHTVQDRTAPSATRSRFVTVDGVMTEVVIEVWEERR